MIFFCSGNRLGIPAPSKEVIISRKEVNFKNGALARDMTEGRVE